jgi:hypothetical protein
MADGNRAPRAVPPSSGLRSAFEIDEYKDANDNRSLTSGLAATCVAILTFVLFFLYGPWTSGSINTLLFQWTLVNIVVSLFAISLASMNFWFVMEALRTGHPQPTKYVRRAEAFFSVGFILLLLEPGLILVTAKLYLAGALAVAFWGALLVLLPTGWRDARR